MTVFHLSHIDLDGYGAQYIAKHFFREIYFFNANYGKEIQIRLETILNLIQTHFGEKILILITDLNLSLNESTFLQEQVSDLKIKGYEITLMLLDHHISGTESAQKFHWYFLDSSRSASKITFDTLIKHYPLLNPDSHNWLFDFSNMVNSVDIWKQDGYGFEFGKVAMGMIMQLKDPNRLMFEEENREIKFFMLEQIKDYLYKDNAEIAYDNDIFKLKKIAFGGDPLKQTMDHILSLYIVHLLEQKKEEMSIFYKDSKGLLTCALGNVSVIGNQFLTQNPDFAFFMDVNPKGNISLRANHLLDVSLLAKNFFNGGGHKNASGGKIEGFKESFFYPKIKEQIQSILQGDNYGFGN